MQTPHPSLGGLWLPLITPFRDGALDEASLRRLVRHYAAEPLDGLILAATTGEGLTLDDDETERLVAITADTPAAAAGAVAASQARTTSVRKPEPAPESSVSTSSPRSP